MQKYLFFCLLLAICIPEKQSLRADQQSTSCEFPIWKVMQASPPDKLFCYDSNNTNIQVTALLIASAEGNLAVMQNEIDRGSDINFQDKLKGYTPLFYATIREHIAAVKLLLENGADPNEARSDNGLTKSSDGGTPLTSAVGSGKTEIVKLLLEHGADPNIARSDSGLTDASDGSTPLVMAADMGYTKIVKLLLEYGADPDIGSSNNGKTVGADGSTPLVMAATYGKVDVVQLLLDYGADPDIAPRGMTPLMFAAVVKGANSAEIARMLLDAGATVNMKDKALGFTALDFAKSSGNTAVAEILEEYVGK